MKKTFILHPYLFAIFPVVFIFSHNVAEVVFYETIIPAAIILISTTVLLFIAGKFIDDKKKAAIVISVFFILFFSYGHAHSLIEGLRVGKYYIGRHKYLMLLWGSLFVFGTFFIIRIKRGLHNLTKIFNVLATVLVAISIINIGVYKFKTREIWKDYEKSARYKDKGAIYSGQRNTLPDIYYIILDGYTSTENLNKFYGYDNKDFVDYLTKKGFYISSKSRSNYALSFLSLPSSLNMEYINYLSDIVGERGVDRPIAYDLIENNKVITFLKSKGYKFMHFGCSGWRGTSRNRNADREVHCGIGSEFSLILLQTTMLKYLDKYLIRNGKRDTILRTFSRLAEVPAVKEPSFSFVHFVPPHPPYLFDVDGKPVEGAGIGLDDEPSWTQKHYYLDQLIFINKKVKELINKILANSEISPIIIIQADHGTAVTLGKHDGDSWNNPTEEMLRERMGIFNAYYLPSGGDSMLYDSITPVNSFRLVFDYYFGTNYGLLPDESYFSTYIYPYKLINVTDKINKGSKIRIKL